MGDGAVTLPVEKQHLCFPCRAGQWPAVREDDRLSRAPVAIIDCSTVASSDRRHGTSPWLVERPIQKANRDVLQSKLARRRQRLPFGSAPRTHHIRRLTNMPTANSEIIYRSLEDRIMEAVRRAAKTPAERPFVTCQKPDILRGGDEQNS